jgi:hypothetical protein
MTSAARPPEGAGPLLQEGGEAARNAGNSGGGSQ